MSSDKRVVACVVFTVNEDMMMLVCIYLFLSVPAISRHQNRKSENEWLRLKWKNLLSTSICIKRNYATLHIPLQLIARARRYPLAR